MAGTSVDTPGARKGHSTGRAGTEVARWRRPLAYLLFVLFPATAVLADRKSVV